MPTVPSKQFGRVITWRGLASVLIPLILVAVLGIVFLIVAALRADKDDVFTYPSDEIDWADILPTATPQPLDTPEMIGDGVWLIGEEEQGGIYRVTEPLTVDGPWCYWTTYSGDEVAEEAVVDRQLIDGGIPTVNLAGVGVFESDDCGTWERVETSELFDNADAPAKITTGEWLVGEDVAPGLYRLSSPPTEDDTGFVWCSWFLYDGAGATYTTQVENGFPVGGLPTVQLATGQTFASDSCGTWLPVDPATLFDNADARTEFGPGVWLVGEDIAPGTYSMTEAVKEEDGFTLCTWSIASTFGGAFESGLDWGTADEGIETVTIATGQQFESDGCGDWELTAP